MALFATNLIDIMLALYICCFLLFYLRALLAVVGSGAYVAFFVLVAL